MAAAAVLGLAGALIACTDDQSPPAATSASPAPRSDETPAPATLLPTGDPEIVAAGLEIPWSIAFAGEAILVSERDSARVLEVLPDGATRVAGTIEGVRAGGEGGLLGLAIDAETRLYAYSTGADGNRVERYLLTGSPGSLLLGRDETIIDRLPSARIHNGGRIAFGPDGMLYVTVGDAAGPGSAQDLDVLGGKILRLTPDGEVPADNPFAGSPVYSYGHRNPQGIAWAPDGTMYSSEFGQNTWDELNIIVAGGNYGWPEVEGAAGDERFTDPIAQWSPAEASPSGIAIAGGAVFVANLRGEVLRVVPIADPAAPTEHFDDRFGRLRDVVLAPDGAVWFLTNDTGDDAVMRVGIG